MEGRHSSGGGKGLVWWRTRNTSEGRVEKGERDAATGRQDRPVGGRRAEPGCLVIQTPCLPYVLISRSHSRSLQSF